jgi:energy-converting hydrogenase A subunit M
MTRPHSLDRSDNHPVLVKLVLVVLEMSDRAGCLGAKNVKVQSLCLLHDCFECRHHDGDLLGGETSKERPAWSKQLYSDLSEARVVSRGL